ncbi:hypothetical protein R3W88_027445 [Solanum pinnatisectum]|uniref:Transcription repressor n=1 Tax=Solanum pinnatisectum TaxID=50273 RepID=A0AAV9LG94_9SOLN|nr:hypothetical protein R3W88_027445 [Solanum pinnatisectum]
MGNYRFRLSDMMPNAWFYKLKEIGKSSSSSSTRNSRSHSHTTSSTSTSSSNLQADKKRQPHNLGCQRKSYYISRNLTSSSPPETFSQNPISSNSPKPDHDVHFTEPSRKSYKKRRSTNSRRRNSPKLVNSSVSANCSCRASLESVWTKADSTPEEYPNSSSSSSSSSPSSILPEKSNPMTSISPSCDCRTDYMNQDSANLDRGVHSVSKIDLPRIITKPGKFDEKVEEKQRIVKQEQRIVRRVSANGVKLRTNSPRITTNSKKIQESRKSVSSKRTSVTESFAVMKSSRNPQKDFRESMVEMIVENNIRTSKDLEELLACYLSLNSDEYHDLIIKVFKQIWFDITEIRLK